MGRVNNGDIGHFWQYCHFRRYGNKNNLFTLKNEKTPRRSKWRHYLPSKFRKLHLEIWRHTWVMYHDALKVIFDRNFRHLDKKWFVFENIYIGSGNDNNHEKKYTDKGFLKYLSTQNFKIWLENYWLDGFVKTNSKFEICQII
jgi:hypothetical protein